jgi:hypothetical protein
MPPADLLIPFFVASAIFACVPGPSMFYTAAQTMASGRRAGWYSAIGFHLAGFGHIAAAAFGVSILLQMIPTNVTGTIIVGTPVDDGDGSTAPLTHIPANYQLLDAMLDGGEVSIAGCDGDEGPNGCLEPAPRSITLEGFQERTRRLLLGDETTPGIIVKLRSNDQELTDEETISSIASRAVSHAISERFGLPSRNCPRYILTLSSIPRPFV